MEDEAIESLGALMRGRPELLVKPSNGSVAAGVAQKGGAEETGAKKTPSMRQARLEELLESAMVIAGLLGMLARMKAKPTDDPKNAVMEADGDFKTAKGQLKGIVARSDPDKLIPVLERFIAAAAKQIAETIKTMKSLNKTKDEEASDIEQLIVEMMKKAAAERSGYGLEQAAFELREKKGLLKGKKALEALAQQVKRNPADQLKTPLPDPRAALAKGQGIAQKGIGAAVQTAGGALTADQRAMQQAQAIAMAQAAAVAELAKQTAQAALQHLAPASVSSGIGTAVSWIRSHL